MVRTRRKLKFFNFAMTVHGSRVGFVGITALAIHVFDRLRDAGVGRDGPPDSPEFGPCPRLAGILIDNRGTCCRPRTHSLQLSAYELPVPQIYFDDFGVRAGRMT